MTAPPAHGPMLCARCSSVRAKTTTPRARSHEERRSSPEALARRAESRRFYSSAAWRRVRDAVRKRDGACLMCGTRHRLTVDHIIPRREAPELAFDSANLRTLCASCHGKRDGGRSRSSRPTQIAQSFADDAASFLMKGNQRPPEGKPSRGAYGLDTADPVIA